MATNWSAYDAAKELYGDNKENIAEIGSRFPLFTRTVALANNEYLLDILKAIPKTTARVVETGLKDMECEDELEDDKPEKTKKKKAEPEEDWEEEQTEESEYESMSGKDLYALCCERGISSQCKSRKKEYLIELLTKLDNGEIEPSKKKQDKSESKASKKQAKKAVVDEEDWEEEEEQTDPYAGKTARELFEMCKKRGLKAETRQKADVYVKLLKADDAKADEPDEEDDDDEWEI